MAGTDRQKNMIHVCDTLRTDDDRGDECVECGAIFADPLTRAMARALTAAYTALDRPVAPRPLTRASRGVTVRSINGFRR